MRNLFSILSALLLAAAPIAAQQGTSARAAGMSGALSSMARGYEAGLYNPALLSEGVANATLLGMGIEGGFAPFGPRKMAQMGPRLEAAEKAELLSAVEERGSLDVDGRMTLHWLGLSLGSFAVNVVSEAAASGSLKPEAAEIILYGNVGKSGTQSQLDASGSTAEGRVSTQASLSYGQVIPIRSIPGTLSAGATLRGGLQHGRGYAVANRASTTSDPLEAHFRGDAIGVMGGTVYGADLGLAWKKDALRAGFVVRDVISGQPANVSEATIYRTRATIALDTTVSVTDTLQFADLSTIEQAALETHWNAPLTSRTMVASAAYEIALISATAEARFQEAGTEWAIAAEVRPLSFVAARAGAILGSTPGLSAGLSLGFGPIALDVGGSDRRGDREAGVFAAQIRFGR